MQGDDTSSDTLHIHIYIYIYNLCVRICFVVLLGVGYTMRSLGGNQKLISYLILFYIKSEDVSNTYNTFYNMELLWKVYVTLEDQNQWLCESK